MITTEIRNRVEEYLNVDLNKRGVNGKHSRYRGDVIARSIYYGLCRELTPYSLEQIGRTLEQHHATVLHTINNNFNNLEIWKENNYIKVCEEIREEILPIKKKLKEEAREARDYIALLEENIDLKTQLDLALRELNNEESYIQKYIMAKTQLNYIKGAVKRRGSLKTVETFIDELERIGQ